MPLFGIRKNFKREKQSHESDNERNRERRFVDDATTCEKFAANITDTIIASRNSSRSYFATRSPHLIETSSSPAENSQSRSTTTTPPASPARRINERDEFLLAPAPTKRYATNELSYVAGRTVDTTAIFGSSAVLPFREIVMADKEKPKLVFYCQQAQGSPTGLISGFTNVKELYEKIAECYDFTSDEILFCTLNTHKLDTSKLLGGQIGLDDFIFVHRKGRAKEIEIEKTEDALGLTITDNGAGYSFIKRIKEGSIIDTIRYIQVGDHIEKINGENMVGRRHFEVAKRLKEVAKNSVFILRLIEPLKAGFAHIGPRNNGATVTSIKRAGKKYGDYGTGRETLRFKANGSVQIEKEQPNEVFKTGVENINRLLENYLGINDDELAARIWETAEGKLNSMEFAEAIDNSDLEELGFTDDFIIETWGVITDTRAGRLPLIPSPPT